jgi:hypothetical protein
MVLLCSRTLKRLTMLGGCQDTQRTECIVPKRLCFPFMECRLSVYSPGTGPYHAGLARVHVVSLEYRRSAVEKWDDASHVNQVSPFLGDTTRADDSLSDQVSRLEKESRGRISTPGVPTVFPREGTLAC